VKLEAEGVAVTAGSKEVPGRKPVIRDNNDDVDDDLLSEGSGSKQVMS
jgi:hypothetical protein